MQLAPSGLILPSRFVDEKEALKNVIGEWLEKVVNVNAGLKEPYFLTFHAKFVDSSQFNIGAPVVSYKLPPFASNTIVYWVDNHRGICEVLWTVPAKEKGKKLKVNFNESGVAYLQAKGAMPSA
ncbi:MAG: hypothetical protein Q8O94_03485 [bacterium]|nr:hypothetical protein [bacterium]